MVLFSPLDWLFHGTSSMAVRDRRRAPFPLHSSHRSQTELEKYLCAGSNVFHNMSGICVSIARVSSKRKHLPKHLQRFFITWLLSPVADLSEMLESKSCSSISNPRKQPGLDSLMTSLHWSGLHRVHSSHHSAVFNTLFKCFDAGNGE